MTQPLLTARLARRADPATVVATLGLSRQRHWQDQLNEPGNGSLILQADDPAHDLVGDGDIIQFLLDGTVAFSFLVRSRDHVTVDPNEAAGRLSTLSGPGLLAVLDEAIVYPTPGLDSQPVQDTRVFGWPAFDFDDSAWVNAPTVATVLSGARGPTMPAGPLHDTGSYSYWADTAVDAENWPDPDAWFIWSSTGPGGAPIANPLEWAPTGDVYFRKQWTVPAGAVNLQFHVLFDAQGELWLDGQQIKDGTYGDEPNINVFSGSTPISPGMHQFAAKVFNDPDPEGDELHNPGGFALTAVAVDAAGGAIPGGDIHTDATWLMLPYPDVPPGVTPGTALLHVIGEAQARGGLGLVAPTFTEAADTAGNPWPVVTDIATRVGNDVLSFARELVATYIDVAMNQDLMLDAWNTGGRGTIRPVTLHPATDPTDPYSGNVRSLIHRRAT